MSRYTSRRVFQCVLAQCILATPVLTALPSASPASGDENQNKDSKDKKESKGTPANPVYEPGGEVTPPKLTHYVEPAFSSSSNEAYMEGSVKISTVVTTEGLPTDLHILRGLNSEEDHTAMEAVTKWRFRPGEKAGHPVYVRVTVEVEFHLL